MDPDGNIMSPSVTLSTPSSSCVLVDAGPLRAVVVFLFFEFGGAFATVECSVFLFEKASVVGSATFE